MLLIRKLDQPYETLRIGFYQIIGIFRNKRPII